MSLKQEKTENKNELKLTFTVPASRFEEAIQEVFKKSAKYFNIPGFRKGKAPFKIVERYYGDSIFYEDAFNELAPVVYDEEIKENKIEVASRPQIDIVQMEKGKELIFTAVVATKPEVKLGKYKEIPLKKIEYKVTDEDIEHEINHMAEHNSRMVTVEDREVKEAISLNLGSIRLKELFFDYGKIKEAYEYVRQYVKQHISPILLLCQHTNFKDTITMFGIGGSIRAYAKYAMALESYMFNFLHGYELETNRVLIHLEDIVYATPQELLEKGIEGLIHISQICEERIAKPEEKLKIGQKVNAKIIDLDLENKKIELSVKELEGTSSEYNSETENNIDNK